MSLHKKQLSILVFYSYLSLGRFIFFGRENSV